MLIFYISVDLSPVNISSWIGILMEDYVFIRIFRNYYYLSRLVVVAVDASIAAMPMVGVFNPLLKKQKRKKNVHNEQNKKNVRGSQSELNTLCRS